MGIRRMYDAAYPPASPPRTDAVAFYIGGDTPHVWTAAEIARQTARYRLPIYVRSNPGSHNPHSDAAAALRWLAQHGAPRGCAVALDLETAVDGPYVRAFDADIKAGGYVTVAYGSLSTIFNNPRTSGGYWVANPTGTPHIHPGSVATQWAFDSQLGHPWDLSDVTDSVPLWDTHAPTPPEETEMIARDVLPGLGAKTQFPIEPGKFTTVVGFADNTYTDGKQVKATDPVKLRVVVLHESGAWQVERITVGRAAEKVAKVATFTISDPAHAVAVSVTRESGDGTEPVTIGAY